MRRIAERIEYSPTTIYLYFKNKEEILYHLCVDALERQLEVISAAAGTGGSSLQSLRAGMRAYVDFGLSEPDQYRITYLADISQYVSITSIMEKGSAADKLCDLMRTLVKEVLFELGSPLDPETVFQTLWAHIHGIVALLIGSPDFPWVDREKLIDTSLDISLRGLVPLTGR